MLEPVCLDRSTRVPEPIRLYGLTHRSDMSGWVDLAAGADMSGQIDLAFGADTSGRVGLVTGANVWMG